jgi:hypothetical protein
MKPVLKDLQGWSRTIKTKAMRTKGKMRFFSIRNVHRAFEYAQLPIFLSEGDLLSDIFTVTGRTP